MNQIYFHIGFHKTGTTWLQKNVFLNKDYFNILNDHIKPWNDNLIKYLVCSKLETFDKERVISIVTNRFKKDKINIVSAERLSGHPYSGGYDTHLIAKKIYKSFPNAKIIIVKREINSFINSSYKQIVKQGFPGNISNYLETSNWIFPNSSELYFNHNHTIDLYNNMFNSENVLKLDFTTFKNNKNVFLESLKIFFNINFSLNLNKQNKIVNKTYSNKRIRAIRYLNRFRKSEYNQYPIFVLNKKTVNLLSILISSFFSSKNFINDSN